MTRKKFKILSRTFCRLYNDSTWPIWGKERSAPTMKNLNIWPKNTSTAHITMGWQSKVSLAQLNNFSKPINPQNPIVEEILDDEGMHFEDEDTLYGAGKTDCCCRWLLFTQPDFENQKSHLEEYITSWSHVCDFHPKYHCELNFIKQYWGAAKLIYRSSTKTRDMKEMEVGLRAVTVDYGIRLSWYGYSTCTVKPSGCQEYGCKFTVAKRVV